MIPGRTTDVARLDLALWLMCGALVCAGVLLCALGLWRLAVERGWVGGAERPVATVIDIVRLPAVRGPAYPVLRFFTAAGERVDARSGRRDDALRPGDIADVVHIAGTPDRTWVRPAAFRFGIPQVAMVTGAGMLALAAELLRSIGDINAALAPPR
jgi:hypothetical protein